MEWETVIGLEIHAQLSTRSKIFSGASTAYGAEPNTQACAVDLGLPGVLPVLNEKAVAMAVKLGLAIDAEITPRSVFARKNYFYPDLPKGYQISQYDRPLATDGWLELVDAAASRRRIRVRRIHIEEDAGKLIHDRLPRRTAIDLNRAGVPLVEIVTEPDLANPAEARAVLVRLKRLLQYLQVSDCDMEKGSLRVDANISLRPRGARTLGTKTEIKNLNSFSNVERALTSEAERQADLLARGGAVTQETLLWDARAGSARVMRSKEESHDYRYFPDPDLPPLVLTAQMVDRVRRDLPELPEARERRFRTEYEIPGYDADVLTADRDVADYFEAVARDCGDPKAASNWVMTEVLAWANEQGAPVSAFPVPPPRLAQLIELIADGTLSNRLARQVLTRMMTTAEPPRAIVEAAGLASVGDPDQLEAWVAEVVDAHPEEAARFREGEAKLLSFFMGRIMKASSGKAEPRQTAELLRSRLLADH